MTEAQLERAYQLRTSLSESFSRTLRDVLVNEDSEVREAVLEQLSEQFRFWI